MRVIFLNRFFHPDHSATSRILSDVAFSLAEKGFMVRIITSRLRYDGPRNLLSAHETVRGVDIHRVWTSGFGRFNLFGRTIDYLTFYVFAGWTLWRLARAGDVIVTKTDPPMLSVVAAPIAHARRAKLINWLQDVFPEVAQAIGGRRRRVLNLAYCAMRLMRDRSLKRACMNVVLGERMAVRLTALGVPHGRVRIIANFADGALITPIPHETNKLRAACGFSNKFVIGYSGNFGRAHEYKTLLAAMEQLSGPLLVTEKGVHAAPAGAEEASPSIPRADGAAASDQEIAWVFVGGGALYGELKREVVRRQLREVRFEPYQPDHRLAESLSAADIHIVSLRPELEGLIVPSKFYGIAAAGRPTIFIGDPDGEIARLIAKHRCGRVVPEGDGPALAEVIVELATDRRSCRAMGERARQAFETEFDKPVAVQRWETLLSELAQQP